MKKFTTHQEILFVTNNTFSEKEFCEIKEDNKQKPHSEKLMDACWNGLITELLPELQLFEDNKKLSIWDVQQSQNFIGMRLGNLQPVESYFSINPYIFYDRLHLN